MVFLKDIKTGNRKTGGIKMSKLYELSTDFQNLFDMFEEINNWSPDTDADGQPIDSEGNVIENPTAYKVQMLNGWFDTLEGIEGEFEMKAENIAAFIKSLKAQSDILKNEETALKKRRDTKDRQIESLKTYLLNQMKAIGRKKIDMPKAVISIRNNAPSLVVDDELELINWAEEHDMDSFLNYQLPKIKKSEVKKACKDDMNIPYVHMESKESLTIK